MYKSKYHQKQYIKLGNTEKIKQVQAKEGNYQVGWKMKGFSGSFSRLLEMENGKWKKKRFELLKHVSFFIKSEELKKDSGMVTEVQSDQNHGVAFLVLGSLAMISIWIFSIGRWRTGFLVQYFRRSELGHKVNTHGISRTRTNFTND